MQRSGPSYQKLVEEGTFKMNSKDAAIGIFSFTLISTRPFVQNFTSAMQKAFYYEGQEFLSDPETYRKIAIEHGFGP